METLLNGVRSVLGEPSFVVDGQYQWGNIAEYIIAGLLALIVVSSVFKFLVNLVRR